MNNKPKFVRILTAALLATAFAGSGLATIGTALNTPVAGPVWIAAGYAAAACGVAALGGFFALAGALLYAGGAAFYALSHMPALRAIGDFTAAWQGAEVNTTQLTLGVTGFLTCAALLLGALFFAMLYKRGLAGMAILTLATMLVFSHGMSDKASIGAAVPGLIAAAAAFALSGGAQRDAMTVKVLIPSALAVALALMLTPVGRVTWAPMEDLAARVRSVFEQYFNFTHERIAFSISEEGYNHGGEIDGQAVAMLGGPANPDPSPVMRVAADGDLLLRGTIRATYTGYSWVDLTPKNRYLYYDLTHRTVRDRVFDLHFDSPADAFKGVQGEVTLIDSGTSTLFVPGRMKRFDMDLANAVFYNSSGEMFMARTAEEGDHYRVEALTPVFGEALRQAALWGDTDDDGQYAAILAAHTQLPAGIDEKLYALTMQVTADAAGPYDRAMAIAGYLRQNMRYRLDVEYPPHGRDFASYFVLDARQGYCSYFATAMAVMGRIAGLPTRYVEGYYARPGESGEVTLTGMDAHAWAEVYFKGLGWIPFDTTNGGPGAGQSSGSPDGQTYGSASDGPDQTGEGGNQAEETPFEDPEKAMDGESGGTPDTEHPEETPEPEDEDPFDEPEPDESDDEPDDSDIGAPPEGSGRLPVWLLILLLLALAALWIRYRLIKADPERLCANARRAQQAAMIAYRANLTLLGHMGQFPQSGETPDAFAARVARDLENPDFADFVKAVTYSRYGGRPLRKADVDVGLRAYRRFRQGMRLRERLRFTAARVARGLGDFEQIP